MINETKKEKNIKNNNNTNKPARPAGSKRPKTPVMPKPLIGIVMGNNSDVSRYTEAVMAAGGAVVLIPTSLDRRAIRRAGSILDGLLLAGGPDVHPSQYGQLNRHGYAFDTERDFTELELIALAHKSRLPILGICRGHQILNVALGGTLIQDITLELKRSSVRWISHRGSIGAGRRSELCHHIEVEPWTELGLVIGEDYESVGVNSLHHQSVDQPGEGLRISAYAPDGVIEGTESWDMEDHWRVSVQFHPEELTARHDWAGRLFKRFVKAAATKLEVAASVSTTSSTNSNTEAVTTDPALTTIEHGGTVGSTSVRVIGSVTAGRVSGSGSKIGVRTGKALLPAPAMIAPASAVPAPNPKVTGKKHSSGNDGNGVSKGKDNTHSTTTSTLVTMPVAVTTITKNSVV